MADANLIERVWFGEDGWARAARSVLSPFELAYRMAVGTRSVLYDRGILRAHDTAVPAASVGNLSVGGTGKTPFAAWLAATLRARGAAPAIVLRGYGEDEPLVHRVLNPDIPVIVSADRVEGTRRARAAGADVAVLDDAFQHRRARRAADFVLVSADRWTPEPHLLPAGPFREPLSALRRATMIVITRKAQDSAWADAVAHYLDTAVPDVPSATAYLAVYALRSVEGSQVLPPAELAGRTVRALIAIGDPGAFVRQLTSLGAVVHPTIFPDHHHFTDDEIAAFARSTGPNALAVCTLKDAVKLRGRWPREAAPLWYVSQRLVLERGTDAVERVLGDLMRARDTSSSTAGYAAGHLHRHHGY